MGSILNLIPFYGATRRNHALEHATMQVLSRRYNDLRMAGISGPLGFTLIGDLPTSVTDAFRKPSAACRPGRRIWLYPNCGTNLVVVPALPGRRLLW